MKSTKKPLLHSLLALLLCVSMLVSSTFAWFTDRVSTKNNIITSGNLDLEMYWTDDLASGAWYNVEDEQYNTIFSYDNWEPGYTEVKYIKLVNAGELALNYDLAIEAQTGVGKLAEVISVYYGEGAIPMTQRTDLDQLGCVGFLNNVMNGGATASGTLLPADEQSPFHPSGEVVMTIAMSMITTAGNEYQNETSGDFTVRALATQASYESDSFGSDYDSTAELPTVLRPGSASAEVTPVDGKVPTGGVNMEGNGLTAFVQEGTALADGADKLTLTVTPMEDTTSGIVAVNDEILIPVDVHVEGIAEGNTVPVVIDLGAVLPKYLNMGNYRLIHVEDGVNQEMTRVSAKADLVAHNQFTYDPATGAVTVAMATFSEIAMLSETLPVWEGEFDYTWYKADAQELTIVNGDQLAAFGAIVGGMKKVTGRTDEGTYTYSEEIIQDNFDGKTVKLVSDINLADEEGNSDGKIFYPIGYYNSDKTYEKTGTAITSGLKNFEGTFDGNGNTISNFYQNTWEMKGDHDWYAATDQYYRDGMGLFGRVYGGTVKNLTVSNFSCDSEIGTTGVIAAYADSTNEKPALFENIAIKNCNPRVYNIGNGGIVGCAGWYSRNESLYNTGYTNAVTFRNITADQTNMMSALWGSWGVSCAGILGQYYPDSKCGIKMENCHVAAIIDVNNDVCSNYQYYWYRYAGMFIGTIRANTKDANGYTVADTTGVSAKDCTYTMGTWNEYWYCEIVANSLASYTHDHQFSRLDNITSLSDIQNADGTWKKEGHFALLSSDRTSVECYHIFKDSNGNLYQHFHDKGDETNGYEPYETVDVNGDGTKETVLKEDRQRYFIPFNQLFTGLDMGIKAHTEFDGIEFVENGTTKSVEKFTATNKTEIGENEEVSVSDLFTASGEGSISSPTVQVYVSPVGYGSTVSATYSADFADWDKGTLSFSGTGSAKVVITDYFYCTSTTMYVTVGGVVTTFDKFETKFTRNTMYRVGNLDEFPVGVLFKEVEGTSVADEDVQITVDPITEGITYTYTRNTTDWTQGTLKLNGAGAVTISITDNDYCDPTSVTVEVVEAKNAYSGTMPAASGVNVVLLENVNSSGFTVDGKRTSFYGNGFTVTCAGDGSYGSIDRNTHAINIGYVILKNGGTLDNTRVVCNTFPVAYMFKSEVAKAGNEAYSRPAISVSQDSTISNCYVYGARVNILVTGGNVTIKDTITDSGALANIHIDTTDAYTITLHNVTTIQKLKQADFDSSKTVLGFAIVVGTTDSTSHPAIKLTGDLRQYNWVTEDDAKAVTGDYSAGLIEGALKTEKYQHTINGKTAVNLGIVYVMKDLNPKITDNRSNKDAIGYEMGQVSMSIMNVPATGEVYSIVNSDTAAGRNDADNDQVVDSMEGTNTTYIPQFKYSSNLGGQYVEKTDEGDSFCYRENDTIKIMFPAGDTKELNLESLVDIQKYTNQSLPVTISCVDSDGNAVALTGNSITLKDAGVYSVTYKVTDTLFYETTQGRTTKAIEYTWVVTLDVSLKDVALPDAYFEFDATKQKMGYYKPTFGDVKQYLPFLAGLKIYDYNGQTAYLRFDGSSDFGKVASITITGYSSNKAAVEVKLTDGGVINTQFLARANSGGGSTYTGKIKTSNNTIYFVTDSGTSNKDTTTTAAYWYVDYYKFTGNNGVEIQSAQQTFNSTGSSASTPSGSFSTTIKYTVTYDANGGNCGQSMGYATSASAAVTLPTPTRSGYILAGWYTAASGGTRVGGAGDQYTPSANITLYAQWGKPCTVTYNANGGSCGTTSEKYTGNALTLPTPTRDGYWFIGWYDAATGGNKIGDAGITYNPAGEITLYAHWQEKIEYTVTYNANGGTCGTESATYQGTALTLPTPTRTGYKFLGWYTATSGGTKIGGAGTSYTPSANITLCAQWEQMSYTITISNQENATVTVDKTTAHYNDTISVTVSFSQNNNKSLTVKDANGNTVLSKSAAGTYTFTMPASNVTIEASSSGGCVTPDTLVTLADGTTKRIDQLTYQDDLLVWNFFEGKYDVAKPAIIFDHGADNNTVIKLKFSDGTTVKVVNMHQFFDADLRKLVTINEETVSSYVGHQFSKLNGRGNNSVKLVDYTITREYVEAWGVMSAGHYNIITEGMLSADFDLKDVALFNYFEVGDNMRFDQRKLQADIAKYGLYTYEDFKEYLTYEQFVAFNVPYFKVSVGKGWYTYEGILDLINEYLK